MNHIDRHLDEIKTQLAAHAGIESSATYLCVGEEVSPRPPYLKQDAGLLQVEGVWYARQGQRPPQISYRVGAWAIRYRGQFFLLLPPHPPAATATDTTTAEPPQQRPTYHGPEGDSAAGTWRAALGDLAEEEAVRAYIRDFFFICQDGPNSDLLVGLERFNHIQWFTPLLREEANALQLLTQEKLLGVTPLRHAPQEADAADLLVTLPILREGSLLQQQYLLTRRTEEQGSVRARRAIGTLTPIAETREVKLRGLPANYLPEPEHWPGLLSLTYPQDAEGFRQLPQAEANAVIADLNRHIRPHFRSEQPVFKKEPNCYPGLSLLQLFQSYDELERRARVLWRPNVVFPLDWRPSKIRRLNTELRATHGWRLRTSEQVASYLRFYFDNTWGGHGPAQVLETLPPADSSLAQTLHQGITSDGTSAQTVLQRIHPIRIDGPQPELHSNNEDNSFLATLFTFDGCQLLRFRLIVWDNGRFRPLAREECLLIPTAALPPLYGGLPADYHRSAAPENSGKDPPAVIDGTALTACIDPQQENRPQQFIVRGEVKLSLPPQAEPIRLHGYRFRGPVRLVARGPLDISECVFESGATIEQSRIAGLLRIQDTAILGAPLSINETAAESIILTRVNSEHGLAARRIRANELHILDCVFDGRVDLRSSVIEGQIDISGSSGRPLAAAPLRSRYSSQPLAAPSTFDKAQAPPPPQQPSYGGKQHDPLAGWVYLGDRVDMSDLRAGSMHLHHVSIGHMCHLDSSIIEGYLSMAFVNIGWSKHHQHVTHTAEHGYAPCGNLVLQHTVIQTGYAWLTNLYVANDLFARYFKVGTSFYLDSVNAQPTWIGGKLVLSSAQVTNILRIRHTVIGREIEAQAIRAALVLVGGGRALGDYGGAWQVTRECTPKWYPEQQRKAKGPRNSKLELTWVGGDLDFSMATIDRSAVFAGVHCLPEAPQNNAGEHPMFRLRSAQVGGDVELFVDRDRAKRRGLIPEDDQPEFGLNLEMPGRLDIAKAEITGDVVLSHARISKGIIDLRTARIGRNLIIASVARQRTRSAPLERPLLALLLPATAQDALRRATALLLLAFRNGRRTSRWVRLRRVLWSPIRGLCRAVSRNLPNVHGLGRLSAPSSPPPAYALSLRMDGLVCEASADISGLSLARSIHGADNQGDVTATRARFGMGLQVATVTPEDRADWHCAWIPGRLDLTESRIGTLSLANDSFQHPTTNAHLERHGIHLDRAVVDRVKVFVRPVPGHAWWSTWLRQLERYPGPIDLRYAEIRYWEFVAQGGAQLPQQTAPPGLPGQSSARPLWARRPSATLVRQEHPQNFIWMLRRDPNAQFHAWHRVASSFVHTGDHDSARLIYKEMRRRLRVQERVVALRRGGLPNAAYQALHQLGGIAWDAVSGYENIPWRLVQLVVVWWFISGLLFANPANISRSELGQLIAHSPTCQAPRTSSLPAPNDDECPPPRPTADSWSLLHGLAIALRYHAPVANFTAPEEWDPSNGRLYIYGKRSVTWSPELYATLVLLCHWLAWPLILVLISRNLFRRQRL